MRRLTAWIGGALGGIAAYRLLRRRPQPAAPERAPAEPHERADELRSKLAESREAEATAVPTPEEPPTSEEPPAERTPEEPPVGPAAEADSMEPPDSPEERRRRVHEEGRSALDEMQSE